MPPDGDHQQFDAGAAAAELAANATEPTPDVALPPPPVEDAPKKPTGRKETEAERSARRRREKKTGKKESPAVAAAAVDVAADDAANAAEQMNTLFFGTMMMLGGADFMPTGFKFEQPVTNEVAACNAALTEYLREQPQLRLPPWAGLLAAYGLYMAPRLTRPTVREKAAVGVGRLFQWWRERRIRKAAEKAAKKTEKEKTDNGKSPS